MMAAAFAISAAAQEKGRFEIYDLEGFKLHITSPVAIDAEIAEARKSLESGVSVFIGGQGGAAGKAAVQLKSTILRQ